MNAVMKVSIFMSIFNVHVNRVPFSGEIARVAYFPGKFFSANLDKASSDNEHNAVFLKDGTRAVRSAFVQIAGLVARRIICHVQEGQTVSRGQRFGLICFGSRLDVYLPTDTNIYCQGRGSGASRHICSGRAFIMKSEKRIQGRQPEKGYFPVAEPVHVI
jgi:phosphatidylserine decarboxylase precursor-related protein